MNKFLLTIIVCLSFSKLYGQEPLNVSVDSSFWIGKEDIEVFISRAMEKSKNKLDANSLSFNDTVGMVQINYLSLNTESDKNAVEFLTNKSNILFYFPSKKESLFLCHVESGAFHPVKNISLQSKQVLMGFPLEAVIQTGAKNIFILNLFPAEVSNGQTFLYYIYDDDKYVTDESFRIFNGIDQLIEYNFGSVTNYINVYNQRKKMKGVLMKQRKLFSTAMKSGQHQAE